MNTFTIISGIAAFVWFGFICSISFLEAPLKFTAPSVTLPIGLDIGRRVFGALNKTEIAFMIIIWTALLFRKNVPTIQYILPSILLVVLLLQTIWLLPALGKRVDLIFAGITPPSSKLHWYYISGELIKMVSLFVFGLMQWKS